MKMEEIARLENVDLREVWQSEAGHFTPWLAKPDNLKILGTTIEMELEMLSTEENVGPFRADIVCRNVNDDRLVLIENQLEKTDHTHLGQIITYASGLEATTIIWITAFFTEEHRAALDWLNHISNEDYNFLGIEIELLRIGNSPVAPRFNMVSKPNEWSKTAAGAARRRREGDLSELGELRRRYWTAFKEYLAQKDGTLRIAKPWGHGHIFFPIEYKNARLAANIAPSSSYISVYLNIIGPERESKFEKLFAQRIKIEEEIGPKVKWNDNDNTISVNKTKTNADDENDWENQHAWLEEKLKAFHSVFKPYLS